jgi:hypothetical protein
MKALTEIKEKMGLSSSKIDADVFFESEISDVSFDSFDDHIEIPKFEKETQTEILCASWLKDFRKNLQCLQVNKFNK